jgi:sugar lactone lactonase YvrE
VVRTVTVESVLASRARLGECPVWDSVRGRLDWIDVYNHRVHEFDPISGRDRFVDTGDVVTAIALAASGRLLVALRDRLAFLHLEYGEIEPLCRLAFARPDTRLNDGKCDPQGRFWVGSMSQARGQAALYRYDSDGTLRVMETGLTLSNGLGWSPDGATFYLTDSAAQRIYAYQFDGAAGQLHDPRVFVELDDDGVEPDGLAVDEDGVVWSALWNGWCVARFDPDGHEMGRISLPVQCPTSLAFGGPDMTDLYITSASVGLSQAEIQRSFLAGDVLHISVSSPGLLVRAFAAGA